MSSQPALGRPTVRRSLRDGDAAAIADLHFRVYVPEFGLNQTFVDAVAGAVRKAVAAGWPSTGGGVWLIDGATGLTGALGLTHERDGSGRVRWFVLDKTLRGRGWGGALLDELLGQARADGLHRLELETFTALSTARRMYERAGFRLTWERDRRDLGSPITFQGYRLELG